MEKQFDGKNVVITGAAEGVGQVIARDFARQGARLIIVDIQAPDKTMEFIRSEGAPEPLFIQCDLRDESQILAMAQQVKQHFDGKVDVLVNNAAYNGIAQLVEDMKLENWNLTLSLNLTGTMLVTREMIPMLRASGSGRVVNTASNVAKRGIQYRADYCCSKWAVLGLTQTLALELVDDNIRVNAVCPGPIAGARVDQLLEMHSQAENRPLEQMRASWEDVPMKRLMEPEEVSNAVLFLASDASSAMTGQALNITGGMLMH